MCEACSTRIGWSIIHQRLDFISNAHAKQNIGPFMQQLLYLYTFTYASTWSCVWMHSNFNAPATSSHRHAAYIDNNTCWSTLLDVCVTRHDANGVHFYGLDSAIEETIAYSKGFLKGLEMLICKSANFWVVVSKISRGISPQMIWMQKTTTIVHASRCRSHNVYYAQLALSFFIKNNRKQTQQWCMIIAARIKWVMIMMVGVTMMMSALDPGRLLCH